jgi:hypothetical protein
MRKWLIAIGLAALPTFALAAPFHGHTSGGMVHGGFALHGGHAFHGGAGLHGTHFARYGHRFARFGHRFPHFRHRRNFVYFAGDPFYASDTYCWRFIRTPFGPRRVWLCNDDYYYYDYGY